jgi:hypothetical protein
VTRAQDVVDPLADQRRARRTADPRQPIETLRLGLRQVELYAMHRLRHIICIRGYVPPGKDPGGVSGG